MPRLRLVSTTHVPADSSKGDAHRVAQFRTLKALARTRPEIFDILAELARWYLASDRGHLRMARAKHPK